jgi:hypothetical protein
MLSASFAKDGATCTTAVAQIETLAVAGYPGALSALAFLTGAGLTRPTSQSLVALLLYLAIAGMVHLFRITGSSGLRSAS